MMNELVKLSLRRIPILGLSFTPTVVSSRNTYILRRINPTLLSRVNAPRPRALKKRHFVYELIQDTHDVESPDIKVVLTSFVEEIGDIGDVLSVMASYGRNHLLLPHKAVYATPENVETYSKLKKERPEQPDFSSIYAGMTIRFLSKKVVPVFLNSKESWTIEPWHIRVAFRVDGVIVPEEAITLPDTPITGPDPTKENKDFVVSLKINNMEIVPVRCRLFHLRDEVGISKLSEEFYLERRDAILEEQEELLSQLPMPEIADNRPEANISLKEKYRISILE